MLKVTRHGTRFDVTLVGLSLTVLATLLAAPSPLDAATLTDNVTAPFGTFEGRDYLIHSGRFEGTTALGAFRVPYEIVVPADSGQGNGTLLVEPPHFALGRAGRDLNLGRDFLFGRGFSYATVGFGLNGLNILDPGANDLVVAGAAVVPPVFIDPPGVVDEEIIVQFTHALAMDPFAVQALGNVERRYAYGVSQTAAVLLEILHGPGGQGLYDLTLLHVALWRPPFEFPGVFDFLDGEFQPLAGVGRVVFVESEGDQFISDAEQFRRAAHEPDYRYYEVSGSAHQPWPTNPLDHAMVLRAIFVASDDWVRAGAAPPPSRLMEAAAPGQIDPVYGFETGIARDENLNARGGVRFPDVEVGRAQFIAADFSVEPLPGLAGILGSMVDLACEPAPGDDDEGDDESRFESHEDYVDAADEHTDELQAARFLLDADAAILKELAAQSDVGKPGSCPSDDEGSDEGAGGLQVFDNDNPRSDRDGRRALTE